MIEAIRQFGPWVAWSLVLVFSTRLDGLFCGLETGIYVMNKNRLDLHAAAGLPAAKFFRRMLASPDRLLATLLIGTNLTRYLATFAISAMFVLAGYEEQAEWLTLAIATPLLLVAADSVPKTVFQRLPIESIYRLSWLLRASGWLFRVTGLGPLVIAISRGLMNLAGPARRVKTALGHTGVAAMVTEGRASGVLTHFQWVMADRVMHISEVTVADAMVPMRHVVTVPYSAGRDELLEIIGRYSYSRLPAMDDGGRVVGILNIYDVLTDAAGRAGESEPPQAKMPPPLVIPAELTVTEALYRMRRA
ncbi:unnamed protein product, partial [marine sediment metagenome]